MKKLPRISKTCMNCGNLYEPKPYREKRSRFCSWECRGSVTPEKKFENIGWAILDDGCWIFRGKTRVEGGYATLVCQGRAYRAHRVSWQNSNGPIPDGMDVLHKCDVADCVNPDHLFLGDDASNIADMDRKERRVVLRGHANGRASLTDEEALEILRSPKGYGTGVKLAKKYGTTGNVISSIRNRKSWLHVG